MLVSSGVVCLVPSAEEIAKWPQFRGENAAGTAAAGAAPPVEFGPSKRVIWKQAILPGHSSPALWGDRIFLTSFEKQTGKLELLCLDRKNGEILWRRAAPAEKIEKVHAISSPATATPAVDGERVYVYFASYGLLAFDFGGRRVPITAATIRAASSAPWFKPTTAADASSRAPCMPPAPITIGRCTSTPRWASSTMPG